MRVVLREYKLDGHQGSVDRRETKGFVIIASRNGKETRGRGQLFPGLGMKRQRGLTGLTLAIYCRAHWPQREKILVVRPGTRQLSVACTWANIRTYSGRNRQVLDVFSQPSRCHNVS